MVDLVGQLFPPLAATTGEWALVTAELGGTVGLQSIDAPGRSIF